MALKRIIIGGKGVKLGSNDGYTQWLERRGVQFLLDNEGDEVGDFDALQNGGEYELGPSQQQNRQPPQQEQATFAEMKKFFDNTEVSQFKFQDKNSPFMDIKALGWTTAAMPVTYWRSCYSYILCSIIGAFEVAYNNWEGAEERGDFHVLGMTMALTGVQGTGKSVLGSFIALFMAKVFQWNVVYQWGNLRHSFGPNADQRINGKTIAIMDFSTVQAYDNMSDFFFILIVSSCNSERWSAAAQQETWTNEGNLIFIDAVPQREILLISERAKTSEQEESIKKFELAGGVARLCSKPFHKVKSRIDSALKYLDLIQSVKSLNKLQDRTFTTNATTTKIYPGLLLHTVPTNPFRNEFSLQISSEYVQKAISVKMKKKKESDIQHLLQELIMIPKARGFASWIWEPLFTMKVKKGKGKLCISGSKLPFSDPNNVKNLFDRPLQDLVTVEFKNLDDFKNIPLLEYLNKGKAILAKAIDDNFVAIDGVLMFVSASQLVVAGLQMTVANKKHLMNADGLAIFADLADKVAGVCAKKSLSLEKQIWFLQPEECLCDFGFTELQPLVFSAARNPIPKPLKVTRKGRKRAQTVKFGDFVSAPKKSQSNNPKYWTDREEGITQFIAIARFIEGVTDQEEDLATAIVIELNKGEALEGHDAMCKVNTPSLRTWKSTLDAFTKLSAHVGINQDFISVLRADIELDRQNLHQLGEQLDALPESGEVPSPFALPVPVLSPRLLAPPLVHPGAVATPVSEAPATIPPPSTKKAKRDVTRMETSSY